MEDSVHIQKSTWQFLRNLARNNNQEWFNAHIDYYHKALENMRSFVDALILTMNVHDQIQTPSGKTALYRIYNDVRFSKEKTPYNPRFAGYLKRTKPMLQGGYYFWIKPGGSRVACGFSHPNPADLRRIREDISYNYAVWLKLLQDKSINDTFGTMKANWLRQHPEVFPVIIRPLTYCATSNFGSNILLQTQKCYRKISL